MLAPWQPLLEWWFGWGTSAQAVADEKSAQWFGKHHDAEAQALFDELVDQALAGGLDEWQQSPQGWLGLLLLLDQLPRMIYRDTPRAFEGDRRAQVVALQGLQKDWDYQLLPIQRVFVLLVLEHAEVLDWQNMSVERYQVLLDEQPEANRRLFEGFLDYAQQHQRVIERFGRFPHRNLVLDRPSTSEEMDFLLEPGSRF
ncbi:DUF924 domain-containing protein [Pseudomonas fulva]|jgi:uncharacterized protein (DUF924 family)|uniref:DUF924 family protein n=1 Tax=Pseudomonas TaxID=286 RepID=UPI000ED529D0|nr:MULTISPECIES: DUF924 family protein [Pseudomonas]MCY4126120.1 DUF924 domain-containing protein [Pseudomonas sp.]MBN6789457.1 DUF924 domain-containing protein [Pseudomonas fulva]MBN6794081.1 DUF924 domain-containing protein [Pseudomonas fulva]MBN6855057.1 DUF924 domain-containing protein [Pseudomonas fulva]MBN6871378.1 DUF924 domain-containing protein [Pseudomonas fulva]